MKRLPKNMLLFQIMINKIIQEAYCITSLEEQQYNLTK